MSMGSRGGGGRQLSTSSRSGSNRRYGLDNGTNRNRPANGTSGTVKNAWNTPLQSTGGGSSSANSPSAVSPGGGSSDSEENAAQHMLDRLMFLLARSVGTTVIVTVASGLRYKGIFSAATTQGELGIVLRYAEKVAALPGIEEEESRNAGQHFDKLVIPPKDCVDICIENPDLTPEKPTKTGFKTDADISGVSGGLVERELQPWTPSPTDELTNTTLEDSVKHGGASWDQFAVNQEKFGIESTYDEHYYTTVIDKKHPEYREREKRAERIAQEITNSSYGGNVHVAEERGLAVDDSGLDEEDKYSGVDRRPLETKPPTGPASSFKGVPPRGPSKGTPPLGPGGKKYTPPQYRAPTGVKGMPGVPYDPAIISSQLATPDGRLTPRASHPKEEHTKPETSVAPSTSHRTGIENELVGNFRQFVSVEVERLHQKKQYLHKKEKSERLHELKKFSEDYKINAPVPLDLVPILAKGKDKQEEIIQRAAANVAAAAKPCSPAPGTSPTPSSSSKPSPKEPVVVQVREIVSPAAKLSADVSPAPPSTTVSPTAVTPTPAVSDKATTSEQPKPSSETIKPKFNVKAAGFRPNPSAHAFTPTLTPPSIGGAPSPHGSQGSSPQLKSNKPQINATFFTKPVGAKSRVGKFNPFLQLKREHEGGSSTIEHAFATPPTWTPGVEKSYVEVLSVTEVIPGRAFFGGTSPRPSIGGFPGASPMAMTANLPMMPASFDERSTPIIPTSPPPMTGQIMPGMFPAMAYGQYGMPPYGAPQYYARPSQAFGAQQMGFPMGYIPSQGYGSPRMPQGVMMPPGQGANGAYFVPQPQYMRGNNSPGGGYSRHGSNSGPQGSDTVDEAK
jgi:hypothetical protein